MFLSFWLLQGTFRKRVISIFVFHSFNTRRLNPTGLLLLGVELPGQSANVLRSTKLRRKEAISGQGTVKTSEVFVQVKDVVFFFVPHYTGFLVLGHSFFKEIGLPLKGDHFHKIEGIAGVVKFVAAQGQ